MLMEFYASGAASPDEYDIVVQEDGRLVYNDDRTPRKGMLRVKVQLKHRKVSVYLANAMFRLISTHQMVTVVFYGFPE